MVYAPAFGFAACGDTKEGKSVNKPIQSDFFKNLLVDILRFYKTGETSFDINQTLHIIKIHDGVIKAMNNLDTWIEF